MKAVLGLFICGLMLATIFCFGALFEARASKKYSLSEEVNRCTHKVEETVEKRFANKEFTDINKYFGMPKTASPSWNAYEAYVDHMIYNCLVGR